MLGSCTNHWNPNTAAMDGKTPQVPERMVELHTEKQEVLDVDDCGQATHKAQGPKKKQNCTVFVLLLSNLLAGFLIVMRGLEPQRGFPFFSDSQYHQHDLS